MIRCPNCQGENVDDARYCANCDFTLRWEPDRNSPADPPPSAKPLELALEPIHTRVAAGENATVQLADTLPAELTAATWIAVGDAARLATVTHAPDGVSIDVRPAADERPRALALEIHALNGRDVAAIARGTLEIVPPLVPPQPPRHAGRSAIAAAGVVALAIVIAIVVAPSNRAADYVVVVKKAVCLHSKPNDDPSSWIPPNKLSQCESRPAGQEVLVRCVDGDVYRLSGTAKRWITTDPEWVAAPSQDVPNCSKGAGS